VVVGDHGEVFGEHRHDSFGHGQYLYEESVHVPFALLHPSLFDGLPPEPRPFQLKDVGPTILDLAGLDPRMNLGRSALRGYRDDQPVFLNNCFSGQRLGLRDGRWKLQLDLAVDGHELYDLEADPEERVDRSAAEPARVAAMQARIESWYVWHQAWLRDHMRGKAADAVKAPR
jgi:arylsulfatase A-like enzyme